MKRFLLILCIFISIGFLVGFKLFMHEVGDKVDEFNGVAVYYNGKVSHSSGRNTAPNGYNLGLKYQCVEFVKRYYFEVYHHEMPNSFGNAKDFFNSKYPDGTLNKERGLLQFANGSISKPKVGDLLVFDKTKWNRFGHVAIVSDVREDEIEIIQQNPGPFGRSRTSINLMQVANAWRLDHEKVLGWLRMP